MNRVFCAAFGDLQKTALRLSPLRSGLWSGALALFVLGSLFTCNPSGQARVSAQEAPALRDKSAQKEDGLLEKETPGDSRAAAFRAVSGPQTESIPGGILLVSAYGIVFFLLLGYVIRLGSIQSKTAVRLSDLEAILASKEPDEREED
ncbi:MAG: CcmD family protein [Myxococcota bacterium]